MFGIGNRVPDAAVEHLPTSLGTDPCHHAAEAGDAVGVDAAVRVHNHGHFVPERVVGGVLGPNLRAPPRNWNGTQCASQTRRSFYNLTTTIMFSTMEVKRDCQILFLPRMRDTIIAVRSSVMHAPP